MLSEIQALNFYGQFFNPIFYNGFYPYMQVTNFKLKKGLPKLLLKFREKSICIL